MNIKDLEYYKVVCEQKSITKAAHALYLTPQGSVSYTHLTLPTT